MLAHRFAMLAILPADSDSTQERVGEIATILAAGLLRLRSRKSSPNSPFEIDSPLDCESVFGRDETGNFKDFER
jgi:hypothetical protein